MTELPEHRLKRLHMRSMRRGIKEMDLILTAYAQANLGSMSAERLDLFEALLEEADQDLYQWVTGQSAAPERLAPLVSDVAQMFQK